MKNLWSDKDAEAVVAGYAEQGVGEDLALRIYSSRLIGGDTKLVQHGGGNTSVRTLARNLVGEETEVICVKGSGRDLAGIEPADFATIRQAPLLKFSELENLTDEEMINAGLGNMLDCAPIIPSVEYLSNVFLPYKYVDHTHPNAILSLSNQPRGEDLVAEVFAGRIGIVPYAMPGFGLAKEVLRVFRDDPGVEGLLLLKHGLFTYAETAKESYQRLVSLVSAAEARLQRGTRSVFAGVPPNGESASTAEVAPVLRGLCASVGGQRFVFDFRTGPEVLNYVNHPELDRHSRAGAASPDHVLRTRPWPLVAPMPRAGEMDGFRRRAGAALEEYSGHFRAAFAEWNPKAEPADALPRVILVPGLGLFGIGVNSRQAVMAADVAETHIAIVGDAESVGTFHGASVAVMFEIEHWKLRRGKPGRAEDRPLTGHVVAVTGGGAIGAATAEAFAAEGAEVAVLDLGGEVAEAVGAAFDRVCVTYGGVDIVVSNGGAAGRGVVGEIEEESLRRSFELNFWTHQTVARHAVRIMRAQGRGGCLLFSVTNSAVIPEQGLGPRGLPESATLALMRQYAIDHGGGGIRSNAVMADGDRNASNLLGLEVSAEDVARAFVDLTLASKTTAAVVTVDGGNIAAAAR